MKTLVIKQTLLTCLLFLSCTGLQAQERIVEQPAFDAWSSTTLEIDKIALSDTATVFYIDAYFRPKYWIQVVKETTLRADGKTYPIKAGDGITLSEKFWMPESGEASFRLIFPPLPKGTKTVDFIEGDEEGAFKIWNIHLDGSPANSSLAGKKNPAETPVLEKPEFKKLLDHANSLDNLLEQQFDCVYLAGGHGAMYDFPDNEALKTIVRKQDESGRIVSAICHGVSGLLNVKLSNGEYMIKGKKLTGFSWFEESLARRKEDVPFDLEALLKERGADYEKALIPMTSKIVVDNNLITGQDPFSSKEMAKVVMRQLNKAQ